jgi:hypothetical protein
MTFSKQEDPGFVDRSPLSGYNCEEPHHGESLSEQFLPLCTFL